MNYWELHETGQRGSTDFPIESYYVNETHPRYSMQMHWHMEYELIRVLKGGGVFLFDDREYDAQQGSVLFVNSGVVHSNKPTGCVYECLVFQDTIFSGDEYSYKNIFRRLTDNEYFIREYFADGPAASAAHMLFDAMHGSGEGFRFFVISGLYAFFGAIFDNGLYELRSPSSKKSQKKIAQLNKVFRYIESHYWHELPLEELAAAAEMSQKYFCGFFKEMTSKTPLDYVNSYRVEKACRLLSTRPLSITQVGLDCGFNDISYFIRVFKKYRGVSPRVYKTQSAQTDQKILQG